MSDSSKSAQWGSFQGYSSPNYTAVPDELFDEQLADLSGAELKVLLYIIRRTFGFKKQSDNISLNQICRGIVSKDGNVLDRGTGLSQQSVLNALKGLIQKNAIIATKRMSKEKGNEPTTYALNILTPSKNHTPPSPKNREGLLKKNKEALPQKIETQETVIQQTDLQHRDISRSTALKEVKEQTQTRGVVGQPDYPSRATLAELTPLSALLSEKQTLLDRRKTTRFSKAPPPELEAALRDVSAKLSDTEHIRENISQAANLYRAWGGVNGSSFASFVYEACAITRQQGSVRKHMPYFFQVLKDLLGLTGAEQGSITPG